MDQTYMKEKPVVPLLLSMGIPVIISMIAGALYNIVDSIFVAMISEDAMTAVSLVYPIQNLAHAAGVGFGVGINAMVARRLGEGKTRMANQTASQGGFLSALHGMILTILGMAVIPYFLRMFTSDEVTISYGLTYFCNVFLFSTIDTMGMAYEKVYQSVGKMKISMAAVLIGCGVNIVLDPIFIFVFQWGMMGAAVATVIGQVFTAILAVWYLLHMKIIRPAPGDYVLQGNICGRMLMLGITSFLSQISLVAAMAAINNMLRKYGALDAVFGQEQYAQIPMAVVGIVMKFFQIVISVVVGMAAGCIPIAGYNMGAEKKLRVRELFTRLLAAEALVGAAALVLAECFPRQLIAVFGAANESSYYTDFAVKSFRVYLCMMPLAMINKGTFIYLQALGKAVLSTVISLTREIVFGVSLPILLPIFFGLDGLLYSFPLAGILTFVIALIMICRTYRELNGHRRPASDLPG